MTAPPMLRADRDAPERPLVIYHAPCVDGFTAAWAAVQVPAWHGAELWPTAYGDPPPDVEGRDVLVVDFAYPREALLDLAGRARGLTVYDHHRTAEEALRGLDFAVFDQGRSGAGLVWDEWVREPRPWLIDYVEDRDLWKKQLPDTEAVNARLFLVEPALDAWDRLTTTPLEQVVAEGEVAVRARDLYVEQTARRARALYVRSGPPVLALVNATPWAISDVLYGALETLQVPIALGWYQGALGEYHYSVRSVEGSDYARRLAEHFGGGGHPTAAGFRTPGCVSDEVLRACAARVLDLSIR